MKAHHLLEVLNMPQDMDKSPNPWLFTVKSPDGTITMLCRDELKKSLQEQTITIEGAELLRTCKLDKAYLTADEIFKLESETVNKIAEPKK